MKRTLSIILSLLMVLSLFTGLNISAAETDAADTGAESGLAETGIDVEVTMPAQLKAALEADDGEGTVRNIKVMHDFTYWTGVKGDNGVASYVPIWCTVGSGVKNLMLNGHKLTFENDYAVTTAHPEMSCFELEQRNTLTLFSIPAGAELHVSDSTYTHSGIWYNGQILKNKDGIDNRDIFHVDGGKLVITGGSYSTEYRTQVYDYGFFSATRTHRLQVNGSPVTVNSGTAVINGGYFEGRGFTHYFGAQLPSTKKPLRCGAVNFFDGRLIINGGYFYGDNGAIPVQTHNSNYKLLTFNGGRFGIDTHDAHIGTEKGEDSENTGCIGLCLYMPINGDNYNYWLIYRDGKGNTYSYQDAVDNKIKKLDDSSEVQFYIEPKGTGYTYRFNANDQLLDESGWVDGYFILWTKDDPLKLSIEPETMSFFGANFKGNSIGQRLTAKMKVFEDSSESTAITEDVQVTFSLKGGKWTLDLADYLNKNLLSQLKANWRYSFKFSFTEEQDTSWHNGAKKTYTVKHDAYFAMQYKSPTYTLTFEPNGGMGEPFTVTVPKGEAFTLPNCPYVSPNSEEFDCWEILVSETGRLYRQPGESYTPKGNDTIRASWRSVYSTVTLQANNGTGETKQIQVPRGGKLTLPPCEFTAPDGTTFYDWQTLDQYGMRYNIGDEITVTKDMTLQAMWEYPTEEIRLMRFNITKPEIGAHPVTTCTSLDPDRYYAKFHQWYIMENGSVVEWMRPEDVFEAGKSYAFGIDIKVLKGRKTADTKIYIGETEAKPISNICDTFAVFTLPGVVNKVEVSLTKPKAGEHPDFNAVVPDNECYEIWKYNWEESDIYDGVCWYDYTDKKQLTAANTFIAGHYVQARVYLQTKSPHTFAPKNEMDFGENAQGSFAGWNEKRGSVDYCFTVEGEKYPVWLGSTQVCEENCDDIFGDHKASYDPVTHTLTLDYPTIDGFAKLEGSLDVDILSEGIDLTVKGGYTMPSRKDNAWLGVAAIGGTLTLDGDYMFYGGNAAVWGDNGVYITGGDIVAEGVWSGISAASSEAPISIGASVDRVKTSSAKAGYHPISGKLKLADNIVLTESDNGYQPGGSYSWYVIYEKKGSELKTGGFSIDDPLAGMTLPTGDMLFDSDLYLGVTDEDYGYINGVRWHDADDNVLPADYTPQSGETVYLDIMLKPAGDNVFTEDTVLTVNGKEVACELIYGRYLMADNIAFTVGGEAAEYILGDTDGDGEITSIDVIYVQRHCAKLKVDIDEKLLMNADVDGNGILEIIDATYIQRWLARMDIPYTIGEAIS